MQCADLLRTKSGRFRLMAGERCNIPTADRSEGDIDETDALSLESESSGVLSVL